MAGHLRLILALLMTVCLSLGCSSNGSAVRLAILTTADLQSKIVPYEIKDDGRKVSVGGLERIAAAAKTVRQQVDGSLLLSSGDDLVGYLYALLKGEPEMAGMTLAGYDVVTPGNHEFDYGLTVYRNALRQAKFDVISANTTVTDPEVAAKIKPWVVKEVAGVKIGLFGLMTPDFMKVCSPPGGGVKVNPETIPVAKDAVGKLKSMGCQLIVALTHQGMTLDRNLAAEVPGIDIIIGGHDHESGYAVVGRTIIANDGLGGKYLGVLRFKFRDGAVTDPAWEQIKLTAEVGSDPKIHALMAGYMAECQAKLGQKIGETTEELDAREKTVRFQESNAGNLITDAWLNWFDQADAALLNSGTIRGDRIYPAGPVTYLLVNEIQQFLGEIIRVPLTGADLKQVLEIAASSLVADGDGCPTQNRAPSGGFLQVGGLRMTIDLKQRPFCATYSGRRVTQIINPGARVVKVEVRRRGNWENLDPAAIYSVLVNDWMAGGGDGYYVFLKEGLKKEPTTMITTDVLAAYIKQHIPVSPKVEGRINFIGK
ncbi:MAG: bifunctional metallophosphatase/5'-nucleotidase [Deltaproteobacteria bacterium]|nr:bifunctional metallophosphatase/5'-nucleotidase [Deltaproteobacteria bacterium]